MNLLDRMFGFDRWTTQRLFILSEGLSDDQLDQEFDIGQRTLRGTFDHMILAMELWTALMTDSRPAITEPTHASVDALRARHAASYDRFEAAAREIVDADRLDETFIDHYDWPQSYGATILQVTTHNHQHRGDILHILQRLGLPNLPDGDPQEWEHMTGRIPSPSAT